MVSSEEAASIFIERIMIIVSKGVDEDFKTLIGEGLPGRVDDSPAVENWYKGLNESEKSILHQVLKASIKETIFRLLVILDNSTGGPPIKGQVSDFSLSIQSYITWDSLANNKPQESIRFNSLKDGDLHDLFLDMQEE